MECPGEVGGEHFTLGGGGQFALVRNVRGGGGGGAFHTGGQSTLPQRFLCRLDTIKQALLNTLVYLYMHVTVCNYVHSTIFKVDIRNAGMQFHVFHIHYIKLNNILLAIINLLCLYTVGDCCTCT